MLKTADAFTEEKEYLLLNKDEPIATFTINNAVGLINIKKRFASDPLGVVDLAGFIANRRAPKQRENIAELLKMSGCDTLTGFVEITHALSLIDTFWVKPIDSELSWDKVSLYTHEFNEVVAKTAFEGGLHGRNLSTTSPEYGTDGSFAKCWIRENGQIKMLKRGSSGAANAGLEPYSEYYAGQLIQVLTDDFVRYDLRSVSGRVCSVCDIFTSEEFGFLPFSALNNHASTLNSTLDTAKRYGVEYEVKRMFVVDAIILNEDRHTNNFGFLINNKTQEIEKFAPLFDHNIALLPYAMESDFEEIDKYVSEKGPRIGETWNGLASWCLDSKMRKALVELTDFKFERHKKLNLPEWRLEALEKLIQKNVREILA